MSNDWLSIDDSPGVDRYIDERISDAVAQVARWLDEQGVALDDPRRAPWLAKVAREAEKACRDGIANARARHRGEVPTTTH